MWADKLSLRTGPGILQAEDTQRSHYGHKHWKRTDLHSNILYISLLAGSPAAYIWVLASPFPGCATLDQLINFSVPLFIHILDRDDNISPHCITGKTTSEPTYMRLSMWYSGIEHTISTQCVLVKSKAHPHIRIHKAERSSGRFHKEME